MKIDFRKQSIPFTQVANEVLNDPDLSFSAKGLYAYLYSKPSGWNFNYVRIAEDTKETKNTVLKYIHELEDKGLLLRNRQANGRMVYWVRFPSTEPVTKTRVEDEKPLTKIASDQTLVRPNFGHVSNKELISNKDNTSNKESLPQWLNPGAWNAWVEYRKEKRQKLTSKSIALQVSFLGKDIPNHVEIIEQSIRNGWTGLFPLKSNTVGNDKPVRVLKFN